MKKIYFLCSFLAFTASIYAQRTHSIGLKIHPLSIANPTAGFEFFLSPRKSITAEGVLPIFRHNERAKGWWSRKEVEQVFNSWGARLGFRHYSLSFSQSNMRFSLFSEYQLRYQQFDYAAEIEAQNVENQTRRFVPEFAFLQGVQFVRNNFLTNVYVGWGIQGKFQHNFLTENTPPQYPVKSDWLGVRFAPRIGLSVGFLRNNKLKIKERA